MLGQGGLVSPLAGSRPFLPGKRAQQERRSARPSVRPSVDLCRLGWGSLARSLPRPGSTDRPTGVWSALRLLRLAARAEPRRSREGRKGLLHFPASLSSPAGPSGARGRPQPASQPASQCQSAASPSGRLRKARRRGRGEMRGRSRSRSRTSAGALERATPATPCSIAEAAGPGCSRLVGGKRAAGPFPALRRQAGS